MFPVRAANCAVLAAIWRDPSNGLFPPVTLYLMSINGIDELGVRMEQAPPADFDEADYLAANPDVAHAVAEGTLQSVLAHYLYFGANENRSLRPGVRAVPFKFPFRRGQLPQRRDKIL